MTATTTSSVTTTAPVVTRARVGWGDLLWLTWRQHRWTILGTVVVVVGILALALGMAWHIDATGDTHDLLGRWGYLGLTQFLAMTPTLFGAVVAVFWAAPLLSREYEQRTHLVVWSQDITPTRWLTGKVVLLGVTAVVLAAGIGTALIKLMNSVNAVSENFAPFPPFDGSVFEAAPRVQAGYAAFGFALGLALSATTRRTVLSMGLALGAFVVTRGVVAEVWRPYFREPVRRLEQFDMYRTMNLESDGSWTVSQGFADAAGNRIEFPQACLRATAEADYVKCMADNDVHYLTDYHPAERLVSFQWFEVGIFAVLTVGLLSLAFVWVRRARRV